MKARGKRFDKKLLFQTYLSQINWDWLFLKGQMIFTTIIILGTLSFILWFLQ